MPDKTDGLPVKGEADAKPFDAENWERRLFKIEENQWAKPFRNQDGTFKKQSVIRIDGRTTSKPETLETARRLACINRQTEGVVHWNNWHCQMETLRSEIRNVNLWQPALEANNHPIQTRYWLTLAQVNLHSQNFNRVTDYSGFKFPWIAYFANSSFHTILRSMR